MDQPPIRPKAAQWATCSGWAAWVDEAFPGLFEANYAPEEEPPSTFGVQRRRQLRLAPSVLRLRRTSWRHLRLLRRLGTPFASGSVAADRHLRLLRRLAAPFASGSVAGRRWHLPVLASLAASTSSMTTPQGAEQ